MFSTNFVEIFNDMSYQVNIFHLKIDYVKILSSKIQFLHISESNGDRLTSDSRFFTNLFRLLVTIETSSFSNEDKFDTLALVD